MNINPSQICIRNAAREDFERIIVNERICYEIPWSEASLEACFNTGYSFFVMEYDQQIIGHMIVQWVVDEVHLHNVCVVPRFQSAGLGKLWITHLIEAALKNQSSVIFLEVRQSNHQAIGLYNKFGFISIGERKAYYQTKQGTENGLVMEFRPKLIE